MDLPVTWQLSYTLFLTAYAWPSIGHKKAIRPYTAYMSFFVPVSWSEPACILDPIELASTDNSSNRIGLNWSSWWVKLIMPKNNTETIFDWDSRGSTFMPDREDYDLKFANQVWLSSITNKRAFGLWTVTLNYYIKRWWSLEKVYTQLITTFKCNLLILACKSIISGLFRLQFLWFVFAFGQILNQGE